MRNKHVGKLNILILMLLTILIVLSPEVIKEYKGSIIIRDIKQANNSQIIIPSEEEDGILYPQHIISMLPSELFNEREEFFNGVTPEEFFYLDEVHLSKLTYTGDKYTILEQMVVIVDEINKIKQSIDKHSSGVILINPNITGQLDALYNGIYNREIALNYIDANNNKDFIYDKSQQFNYYGKMYEIGDINRSYLRGINENYNKVNDLLHNVSLYLDKSILDNLVVQVSPYKKGGIGGYSISETKSGKEDLIMILNDKDIELTLLHELGHIVNSKIDDTTSAAAIYNGHNEEGVFWDKYKKIVNKSKYNQKSENINENWRSSLSENFAEDFKVYMYKKTINKDSVKRTEWDYNDEFDNFIEDYLKSISNKNTNSKYSNYYITNKDNKKITELPSYSKKRIPLSSFYIQTDNKGVLNNFSVKFYKNGKLIKEELLKDKVYIDSVYDKITIVTKTKPSYIYSTIYQ